ncbi:hypothetical protein LBMAG25_18130 [Bacteroidota bacterium]|nr:hypothetical protein LBMAG25_18130 [Bacteroidota bacterium]
MTPDEERLIERLFPFYLLMDAQLHIVQAGQSVKKIIGDCIDKPFTNYFTFLRPGLGIRYHIDSILQFENQIFILKGSNGHQDFRLKGQVVRSDKHILFCGSPWITSESDFIRLGLKVTDFAIHDSTIDMMQNLRVLDLALMDSTHVNNLLVSKNEELTKTNAELDRFVYSVSHDLRAPLTSLLGLMNICNETLPQDELFIRQILSMMQHSVNKMDAFISEILDYSRNSRKEITPTIIDFNSILTEANESLKYTSNVPGYEFSVAIQEDNVFYSDEQRVSILLNNLISNAIKYLDVSKAKSSIRAHVHTTSHWAKIIIEDNGIGIDSSHQTKVFDMFYRATDISTGSGLGLYIVREIMHKLEGTITLESTLNQGTSVTIEIPNLNLNTFAS